MAALGALAAKAQAINNVCIKINCNGKTERVFCGTCFWTLDNELRRRLQIGATKTQRNPNDRRAAKKYALVVADALELLGSKDGDNCQGQNGKPRG